METVIDAINDVRIHDTVCIIHDDLFQLGKHIAIDFGVYVSTELVLHNYIHLAPHLSIIGGRRVCVEFKDFTWAAAGSRLIGASESVSHMINPTIPVEFRELKIGKITLEKHAGIFTNCTVGPGVTMAEGSILAANSFLDKDTEPWTIYGGSPAKPISDRSMHRDDILIAEQQLKEKYG